MLAFRADSLFWGVKDYITLAASASTVLTSRRAVAGARHYWGTGHRDIKGALRAKAVANFSCLLVANCQLV